MKLRYLPLRHNPVLATALMMILVVCFAGGVAAMIGAYLLLALCVLLANVRTFGNASQREANVALALVLATSLLLPVSLMESVTAVVHYAVVLISFGIAFLLTRDLDVYLKASRLTLLAVQFGILIFLARRGLDNFPLQDMVPNWSANAVTSCVVVLQANYCIVHFTHERRTSLPTALLTLAICMVGFGRGSILAATAIVTVELGSRLLQAGRGRASLVAASVFAALLFLGVRYAEEIEIFVKANTKIGGGLFDAHRYSMINEYLDRIDVISLWTGASYAGTSIVSEYNNNPHNSFIRAHHLFGLPYLLLLFAIPLYLIHRAHTVSVKLYAATLWLVVLFRAFTEPILFPTLFDFFFFGACFALGRDPGTPESAFAEARAGQAQNRETAALRS